MFGVNWIFLIFIGNSFNNLGPLTLRDLSANLFFLIKGTPGVDMYRCQLDKLEHLPTDTYGQLG